MTTGCNIFKDSTAMPTSARNELDAPVRVQQETSSPKGAMVNQSIVPQGMTVEHVTRPRRGHDY